MVLKDVNQLIIIMMITEVKTVLVRWAKSVKRFKNLDKWSLNEDFNRLSCFIRTTKDKSLRAVVSHCRDLAIVDERNYASLEKALERALGMIEEREGVDCSATERVHGLGQRERYNNITMSMGKERIKRCDSRYLRNLDVTILEPKESRIIRRIVEKRMCQEYHRQHKENFRSGGNRSRHQMRRAVSFQLYNIGQMEGGDIHRGGSTHWKWQYDSCIKEWVLKKKVAYRTEEEARVAAFDFMARNPEEGEISVYRCSFCKMFHIGHSGNYEMVAV